MDDEIIYSWCFNSVEYFDSTSSAAIIVLVQNLESFSSLKSQHVFHAFLLHMRRDEISTVHLGSKSHDFSVTIRTPVFHQSR